jgi:hypothetical protein
VHHDRVHADQLEQHDIAREAVLQRRVGHRVAAVFDDDGFFEKSFDLGQRFGQGLCLLGGSGFGEHRISLRVNEFAAILP